VKNILITGVGGFCGRHLAKHLRLEKDVALVGYDRLDEAPAGLSLDDYISGDVLDQQQLNRIVGKINPQEIFHLAGISTGPAVDIYRTNVLGTIHLLEAVRTLARQARVLLVGSAAEYGPLEQSDLPVNEAHPCNPIGAHGLSKYAATLAGIDYARNFAMKVVVARPSNIIGAGIASYLLVGAVLERIRGALATPDESTIKVGNVDTVRDFIAVEDVVAAYLQMIRGDHWGEIFNISSGQPSKISFVIETLLSLSPRPLTYEIDPSLVRPLETKIFYASHAKAKEAFGFKATISLEDSIRAAWAHEIEMAYDDSDFMLRSAAVD